MKSASPILGMQVVGLDLKWANRHDGTPTSGLFLMFDDGTYYEFRATKGYLEMGRHLPPQHRTTADLHLANYYVTASSRLPPPDASNPDGKPFNH
ncbi:MAG: hypothetical protein KGJ08_04565 [Gammaproteobacteria bacterium]|nr:hypothetical protein [Gammaproteobacteria bacterium]